MKGRNLKLMMNGVEIAGIKTMTLPSEDSELLNKINNDLKGMKIAIDKMFGDTGIYNKDKD